MTVIVLLGRVKLSVLESRDSRVSRKLLFFLLSAAYSLLVPPGTVVPAGPRAGPPLLCCSAVGTGLLTAILLLQYC